MVCDLETVLISNAYRGTRSLFVQLLVSFNWGENYFKSTDQLPTNLLQDVREAAKAVLSSIIFSKKNYTRPFIKYIL